MPVEGEKKDGNKKKDEKCPHTANTITNNEKSAAATKEEDECSHVELSFSSSHPLKPNLLPPLQTIIEGEKDMGNNIPSPGLSPHRASALKTSFVEVCVCAQRIEDIHMDTLVAVYLQAAAKLYEVIIIQRETAEELYRLYVFEEEISEQMKARRMSLESLHHHSLSIASSGESPKKNKRRGSASDCAAESRPRSLSEATNFERQRRKSMTPIFRDTQAPLGDRSSPNVRRKSLGTIHNELLGNHNVAERFRGVHRERSIKDFELHKFLDNDSPKVHIRSFPCSNPLQYFDLMKCTKMNSEVECFKKISVDAEDISCRDVHSLHEDISFVSDASINYFSFVILHSLFARYEGKTDDDTKIQFILFEEASKRIFNSFECIPGVVKEISIPTDVNPVMLINTLSWNASLAEDKAEMHIVKILVESAMEHSEELHSELQVLHETHEPYKQENSVNPNSKSIVYKQLWQSAYKNVMKKLEVRRELRATWGRIVDQQKEANEMEKKLLQESREMKFRELSSKKGWQDMKTFVTPSDIADYRRSLKAHPRDRCHSKHSETASIGEKTDVES